MRGGTSLARSDPGADAHLGPVSRLGSVKDAKAARPPVVTDFVTRDEIAALSVRSDLPGLVRVGVHLVVLAAAGYGVARAVGTPWLALALIVDGFVIAQLFALMHECAHKTAFGTGWLGSGIGTLAGYAIAVPPFHFRREHIAHHAFTQDATRDPERIPVPSTLWRYGLWMSSLQYWWGFSRSFAAHLGGRVLEDEHGFLRTEQDRRKVVREARLLGAIYLVAIAGSLAIGSTAVLVFWIVPRLVGEPFLRGARIAEHAGRSSDRDITENTRTFDSSWPVRWLSYNMTFHAEHHAAPSVPFHRLPALRQRFGVHVRGESGGYVAAQAEIVRAIRGRASSPTPAR